MIGSKDKVVAEEVKSYGQYKKEKQTDIESDASTTKTMLLKYLQMILFKWITDGYTSL